MTKQQIAALPKKNKIRHIIHEKSLNDWFPDGIKREMNFQLAKDLHCKPYDLDICIEYPESILRTSAFFSGLVMARLAKTKVYWWITNENHLLADILKTYPISDVILSDALSDQLVTEPTEALLEFIEQAQLQEVNIIASLAPSNRSRDMLALYGIESVLSQ
jgi:hypothetical protein